MKRTIALLCATATLLGFSSGCAARKHATIYDANGAVIATPRSSEKIAESLGNATHESYVTYAVEEAVAVLAALGDGDVTAARKNLFRGEYTVHTLLDPTVQEAVAAAYAPYEEEGLPFGCAAVDDGGGVRAIYSGGDALFALNSRSPCSAIKPLSVYAPAVEFGVANWGTSYKDTPYKKITDLTGQVSLWPTNANGKYTGENTALYDCVRQSLNTTAVHCLKQVGVNQSLKFLKERLGMNVAYEQNKAVLEGEDEVIGNVAMGFLYTGCTPIQMAGYYRIFGGDGMYTVPHCVREIRDADGNVVYTFESEAVRVIEEDTSYIVNRLLQSVVSPSGTGKAAKVKGTELVGKTGTSDEDNWFVGVTPEYSVAVWHGNREDGINIAPQLFTKVFEKMPTPTVTKFTKPTSVVRGISCMDSGMRGTTSCPNVQIGYYAADRLPAVCDAH